MMATSDLIVEADWKDVNVSKKKHNPKVFTEEIYILSDLLCKNIENGKDSACIRCINRSCKNTKPHGEAFPDKISHFVQNPLHINGLNQYVQNANLDFNGKQPFYTICNYLMGKCKNCEEGRIKYIDFENDKLGVCYPSLDRDNIKITVGMHIDIKLILKGKKYEVSALPFEVIINKKELYLNEDMVSIKEEWPSLDVDHKRKRIASPVLNFSHIKDSFKNDDHFYPIQENLEKDNNKFNSNPNNKYIDDIIREYKNREYDILDELDYVKKDFHDLLYDYHDLKDQNKSIIFENYELKNKIDELTRSINNNLYQNNNDDMYNEIIHNMNNINTRVTNQFLKSEYNNIF